MTSVLKPIAFRIRDYRSIKDSGICSLSRDYITVLAGQNEAGKTAILLALTDFDQDVGQENTTENVVPEDNDEARPDVGVLFEFSTPELWDALEDKARIPTNVRDKLEARTQVWVFRDILSGSYHFDEEVSEWWADAGQRWTGTTQGDTAGRTPTPEKGTDESSIVESVPYSETEMAEALRTTWPVFVYFDSFNDVLPPHVELSALVSFSTSPQPSLSKLAQPVQDFIVVSGLDLSRLARVKDSEKAILNYLEDISGSVTGDFQGYYKQRSNGAEVVQLALEPTALGGGTGSRLSFFIKDDGKRTQPNQRSRGFLWFLSFYLRLAALGQSNERKSYFILIDEPGTNLHVTAQRDVLGFLEAKCDVSKTFLYTTHSPVLLPVDKMHRVRTVIRKRRRGTMIVDKITSPELQGEDAKDALTPIILAFGMDVRDAIQWVKQQSVITEGVSDFYYLYAWANQFDPEFVSRISVFPSTGARGTLLLASLFTGWGVEFIILLDRDSEGESVRQELLTKGLASEEAICQIDNGKTIEDIFEIGDFRRLFEITYGSAYEGKEDRPSKIVERAGLNKILLAKTYAEHAAKGSISLSKASRDNANKLLGALRAGIRPAISALPKSVK